MIKYYIHYLTEEVKTIMRYHHISIKMPKTKKQTTNSWECGASGTLQQDWYNYFRKLAPSTEMTYTYLWPSDSTSRDLPNRNMYACDQNTCSRIFIEGTTLVVHWLKLHSQCRESKFDPWSGQYILPATTKDPPCHTKILSTTTKTWQAQKRNVRRGSLLAVQW